jgi:hypothetical protein
MSNPASPPGCDNAATHKSKWSVVEDEQLRKAIKDFGVSSWNKISHFVPTRTGKQCRERWLGQLAPSISKETWSPEEDATLIRSHATAGNKWTIIAAQLPGRAALSVKNRWNWLTRHSIDLDRLTPSVTPHQAVPVAVPDIVERRKRSGIVLQPLGFDARLFGPGFQEFQAKMFMS